MLTWLSLRCRLLRTPHQHAGATAYRRRRLVSCLVLLPSAGVVIVPPPPLPVPVLPCCCCCCCSAFEPDAARYLLMLALVPSGLGVLLSLGLNYVPFVETSEVTHPASRWSTRSRCVCMLG